MCIKASILLLFLISVALCAVNTENNQEILYRPANLGDAAPDILKNISEFVGAHNPLPKLNKHTCCSLTKLHPIKVFAETVCRIEGIKDCSPSEVDLDNLMKLPVFSNECYRFQYFALEILIGKYRSTESPVLIHLIKLYAKLDGNTQFEQRSNFWGSLSCRYEPFKFSKIFLASENELSQCIIQLKLHTGMKLSGAFSVSLCNAFFINCDTYTYRWTIASYLILNGADKEFLMLKFENVSYQIKAKFFFKSICSPLFVPSPDVLDRLKNIITKYFPIIAANESSYAFLINAYLNAARGQLSDEDVVDSIITRNLSSEIIAKFALLMSRLGKNQIMLSLLSFNENATHNCIKSLAKMANLVKNHTNSHEYAIRVVKDLIALVPVGEDIPIDYILNESINEIFFTFYEVESVVETTRDRIEINCIPVSAENNEVLFITDNQKLLLFKQEFTEPVSINFSINMISDLLNRINTRNVKVLEHLMGIAIADGLKVNGVNIELSPSFLRAAQHSKEFSSKLWRWRKIYRRFGLDYSMKELVLCLDYPVDNIIGKVDVKFYNLGLLEKRTHFINLQRLTGKSCAEIYELSQSSGIGFAQPFGLIEIHSIRPFLIFWIESEEWESLRLIKSDILLDYLAIDYPKKISQVRRLKRENY